MRPEMPFILVAFPFACDAEGLARAGAGPDFDVARELRELKGQFPAGDAGEEVGAAVGAQEGVPDVDGLDVTGVDNAVGDEALVAQVAEPLGGVGVELVVVGQHA